MKPLVLSLVISVTSLVDARAQIPFYQAKTIAVTVGCQAGDGYDPSTQAPALAGASCSGFRPTGGLDGATGLPAGLHKPESRRVFCHIVRGIRVKPQEL